MRDASRARLAARATATLARLPWWVLLSIGLACLVVGAALTVDPLRSLRVLARLVAAALLLTGISGLVDARATRRPGLTRLAGFVRIGAGVLALTWPGITIGVLAVAVGISLVVGGIAELAAAVRADGDERVLGVVGGLTDVIVGLLALAWPAVTVLVLAVLFGLRTMLFGLRQVAAAWRQRRGSDVTEPVEPRTSRWSRPLRTIGTVTAFALAVGGTAVSVAIHRAQPGEPGPFYDAPSPLPDEPLGTVLRQEVVDGYVAGATTFRVLYLSTGLDGEPAAVSGLIVVPDGPAQAGGRPVVAYAHGTVGVTPRCGPSLQGAAHHPLFVEGGQAMLDAGYVITAPDYAGLGTAGTHPYLVGEVEAMNTLDSVRAARDLLGADASTDVVVWGHSQGGHASLFTGQLAPTYAPELELLGVAAGAPVPDLVDLFEVNVDTTVGKVLIAMALHAWGEVFDDAHLADVVRPEARPVVRRVAQGCLYGQRQLLGALPGALVLDLSFLSQPVWEVEPWRTIAADNTPGATPIEVPMLIVQGGGDTIVAPEITLAYVEQRCAEAATLELLELPGLGHVETSAEAAPMVVRWIGDRFERRPPTNTCD